MQSENSLPGYIAEPIIVGIDEAGRGPIAGPVTVAAVAFLKPFDVTRLTGVKDSKKLSEKKREYFRAIVEELSNEGCIKFAVHSSEAKIIDSKGIVFAIQLSLSSVLNTLSLPPSSCFIKLDGSLKAPSVYKRQETIIKGDESELPITLAGIMAKTTRDRNMLTYAKQYPEYGFEHHKGYGTKMHYQALTSLGACELHRTTFLKA